MVAIPIS